MDNKKFPPSDTEIKEKSINKNRVIKVIPINKNEEDKKKSEIYKQILNRKIE